MAQFEIRPKDYVDLKENLSEKNIINTIEGREYVVTSIEGTQLHTETINPDTVNKIFDNGVWRYNPDLVIYTNSARAGIFGLETDTDYARTETLYLSGKYLIFTDEVIEDDSSIGCSFVINYTKSKTDALTDVVYNVRNSTAFFRYGGVFPTLRQEGDDNLSTDEFLPAEQSVATAQFLWAKADAIAPMPAGEYCNVRIKSKTASSTTLEVSYRFKIWTAWATDNQSNNTALAVNSITINTFANTVDTSEMSFLYKDDLVGVERKYELETNELFQTTLDADDEDKLSHKTYEKIVNAYDTDRRVITFDLLNPVRVSIDDALKFENSNARERCLDTDDEFDIYDEHNKFMGTFKVLQSNPIWDGAYHKRITAILAD